MMEMTLKVYCETFLRASSHSLADHFELFWLSAPYPVPFFFLFLSSLFTLFKASVPGTAYSWGCSSSLSTLGASLVISLSLSRMTSRKSEYLSMLRR